MDPLRGQAGVAGYDATTGASLWYVPLGRNATTPALAGGRGFTAVAGGETVVVCGADAVALVGDRILVGGGGRLYKFA